MTESIHKVGHTAQIKFTDKDVVNPDDFIPATNEAYKSHNPHHMRPWLIHDHGTAACVVFAQSQRDALDEAANAGKLDPWQIDPSDEDDRADYMTTNEEEVASKYDVYAPEYVDTDGVKWYWNMEPTLLGNAGEPFDIEGLEVVELPIPKFSFCTLFNAMQS